ncbi:hypothetical protein FXO37_34292 [Capsicum annuum]|nr:hypothetical protein FXO37_34292 [Capsicum annuum]
MDNFLGKILTEKVLRLKSSTHQNVVVASSPCCNGSLSSWCVPPSGFGEVRYTSGYWEWIEDVLARNETLERNKTCDAIFASLFTYDHNKNMLQAFYENWRPSTNTVSTFIGELKSINISDQHREFADLDSISIDTIIVEDGVVGSTIPLADLAHQLGLVDVSSNIFGDDVFGEDCVTSPNPSSVLKGPNLSLDNAMTQATNKDRSTKLSENIESFQNFLTTDMVAEANDNRPSNVPKVWFSHYIGLL